MLNLEEQLRLYQRCIRAERVALELASLLQKDGVLFKKIKTRTKRWLLKQDKLKAKELDILDEAARKIKLRNKALGKLTVEEKELLGLPYVDESEEFMS